MRLHLHPYPPHRDTLLELSATGLVCIHGLNGAGKSSFVEAYTAVVWARSLRGAGPWRSPNCHITLKLPSLTIGDSVAAWYEIERTPESLSLNGASALKPSKKQADVTALFGDFGTWQRTRVFDADLTARFGAATDGDRKRLLEQLLGLEKLDEGLRRCREDKREAERQLRACEQALYIAEDPAIQSASSFDAEALARASALLAEAEQRARELAAAYWRAEEARKAAERRQQLFRGGHCPMCEQTLPQAQLDRVREVAVEAKTDEREAEIAARRAEAEEQRLVIEVRRLHSEHAVADRAAEDARRRDERRARRAPVEAQRKEHARTLRRLQAVEAFIVEARPKLLRTSLAILETAASAWLPGLHVGEDGALRHGARSYKELNEGHRRLCDMAVLFGLSGMSDAKIKGPIWLEGSLFGGLDDERSDAITALFERVAERELVIVLTCHEETAQRLRGTRIRVADGCCEVIR